MPFLQRRPHQSPQKLLVLRQEGSERALVAARAEMYVRSGFALSRHPAENLCHTTITRSGMALPFIGWRANMASNTSHPKRTNGRYESERRTWLKLRCLNPEEFVVVGCSDPEGSRHRIEALLLGYYTPDNRLIYSGRVGSEMPEVELERPWQRLPPLVINKMPLAEPPP